MTRAVFAMTLLLFAIALSVRAALPELSRGKGAQCVEPTDVMRRSHMDFLLHQRDDTVRGGIRGAKHSLIGCIECHVQRDDAGAFIRIDASGQFCAACHEFAAVEMDCFECHAATPSLVSDLQ